MIIMYFLIYYNICKILQKFMTKFTKILKHEISKVV